MNNIYDERSYYEFDDIRNPGLYYTWDFNRSLPSDVGGRTYNSSYFEIKSYTFLDRYSCKLDCLPPYEITFKHEEGHILANKILNISHMDDFNVEKNKEYNLTEVREKDEFRQYLISVSEGISDYYAVNYFNNEMSDYYYKCIETGWMKKNGKYVQHYQGLEFVNKSIISGEYSNLEGLIADLGSWRQYENYSDFVKGL